MSKTRSIFEEVDHPAPVEPKPGGGLIDRRQKSSRRWVAWWLMSLFALVVVMILVGGLTRLTDSGLSITEWKPVTGAIPPMNAEAWALEFEKYQTSPEYQLQNSEMTVEEFKSIYWWEWGHRQLGRLIGLVWAIGFVFFILSKGIPKGWTPRLLSIGVLGGLQGAIGWWMVSSGLGGRMVDVASYRLAIHLGLAFLILSIILWFVWLLGRAEIDLFQSRRQKDVALTRLSGILFALAFAQILLGALVAGIDAGRSFPTWPLMAGEFLPSESFDYTPLWSNFFENPALVQFNHRMLGYLVFIFAGFTWWRSRRSALVAVKRSFTWMFAGILAQVVLGIGTVILAAQLHIALTHQLGAVLVIVLILRARFAVLYPKTQSLR